MSNQQNNDIEIDLIQFFKACIKKWWLIVAIAILCGIVGFISVKASYMPYYESTATIYVLPQNQMIGSLTGTTVYENFPNDCVNIVTMPSVLEAAIEDAGLTGEINYDNLSSRVSAVVVKDTSLINIKVKDLNAGDAKTLADAIAKNSVKYISDKMKVGDPQFIEEARIATAPIGTGAKRKTIVFGLIGLVISSLAVICVEYCKESKKRIKK